MVNIRWTASLPGDAHHLLAIDPSGGRLFAGDGWGSPSYASLSLRLIDMNDGRELERLRTRYQQPRSITFHEADLLLATDSRLFEIRRSDLMVQRSWARGVPRFADALEFESGRLLMTNWLRPTAAVFDLSSGRRSARWLLEAGLRPLRRRNELLLYSLRSGLLRKVDIATRPNQVISKVASGLGVALAASRWLAVLTGPWTSNRGDLEEPASKTRELLVFDLNTGAARGKNLSRDTVAVEASNSSPILWLAQRGPGPKVVPSIVERVDAESCQTVDVLAAPEGSDVVQVVADQSVVFFGQPQFRERQALISCGVVD